MIIVSFVFALFGCGIAQTEECAAYLACQEAVDEQVGGSSASTIEPLYGPDGTCWTDAISAAACESGCSSGLQAARDSIDPVPTECAE